MPHSLLQPRLRAGCLVLLCFALAGCLGDARNGVPPEHHTSATLAGYSPAIRVWGDETRAFPPEAIELLRRQRIEAAKSDPEIRPFEINALTLSGGGSSGAFGAGILTGWTEKGSRPKFDVVTGISTGALIAPFAFLGSKYDAQLTEAFTTVDDDDIYEKTGLAGILRSGAFTSNEPLRKMLDKYITEAFIDEVAVEFAKGRRLLVGTTNLDADRPVIWNMGAIAASGRPDRARLFK